MERCQNTIPRRFVDNYKLAQQPNSSFGLLSLCKLAIYSLLFRQIIMHLPIKVNVFLCVMVGKIADTPVSHVLAGPSQSPLDNQCAVGRSPLIIYASQRMLTNHRRQKNPLSGVPAKNQLTIEKPEDLFGTI